eukprot:374566-Prymnesium_polylepis.1
MGRSVRFVGQGPMDFVLQGAPSQSARRTERAPTANTLRSHVPSVAQCPAEEAKFEADDSREEAFHTGRPTGSSADHQGLRPRRQRRRQDEPDGPLRRGSLHRPSAANTGCQLHGTLHQSAGSRAHLFHLGYRRPQRQRVDAAARLQRRPRHPLCCALRHSTRETHARARGYMHARYIHAHHIHRYAPIVACHSLLQFDLTRHETLDSVREWHRKARALNKCAMPVLVGAKYDLALEAPTADHA